MQIRGMVFAAAACAAAVCAAAWTAEAARECIAFGWEFAGVSPEPASVQLLMC